MEENFETNKDKAECPFGFGTQNDVKNVIHSNKNWWPNQLNLKILHQNSVLTNPMDKEFNYAEEFKSLDLKALKNDLYFQFLKNLDHLIDF